MIKKVLKKIFPRGSFGFKVLKKIAIILKLTPAIPHHELKYSHWTERVEPLLWSPQEPLNYRPLISVVVPVFNAPIVHQLSMVYSVVNQTYPNWQLILINASSNRKLNDFTAKLVNIDTRIEVVKVQENTGIAGNTNIGIKKATGEYVAFLDHDDTIAHQALYEVVRELQGVHKPKLLYSDEDKLTNNGEYRLDPHFKPDWSPHLLREVNYLNHLSVVEKKLLNEVGAYRSGFDGAQDYDLFLRLVDKTDRIAHIPKILYHWRTAKTSTAEDFSQKKNILQAGTRALEDHLARNKQHGKVIALRNQPGFYKINYRSNANKAIAVLLLPSKLEAEYRKFLFIFLEDLSKTKQKVDLYVQQLRIPLKNIPENVTLHFLDQTMRKDFITAATNTMDNKLCLVIGSAVLPMSKGWLTGLTGLLLEVPSVAMAAPLVLASDGRLIIDAGYVKSAHEYMPLFRGYTHQEHTVFGNSDWVRHVDALSTRCFIMRKDMLAKALPHIIETGTMLFTQKFFDMLQQQDDQVVIWPFSCMVYAGEMAAPTKSSRYFSGILSLSRAEFKTIEVASVRRNYEDD